MHPSKNYVKYIFLRELAQDEGEVTLDKLNYYLGELGLPKFSSNDTAIPQYIAEEVNAAMGPSPLQFYNKKHKPTRLFMRQQKLFDLWVGSDDMEEAKTIFALPAVKEAIQLMFTGRLQPPDIASRLPRKFGVTYSPRALALYAHYFWDVSSVSSDSLGDLLFHSPSKHHYMACYFGSRDQALWRAGFSPKVDPSRALNEAHRSLYFRIEATRTMADTVETSRILTMLTKELVAVHQAINGEGAGVEEQVTKLRKSVHMVTEPTNVIPINRLAANGNFSGSGK